MATAFADDFAQIVLGIAMFCDQLLVAKRLFQRIEVCTLHVFNNRQLKRRTIIDIADDDGNFNEAGKLCCPPAAFAGDDFIPIACRRPNDDGLHDPMLTNGTRQILKFRLVEIAARVLGATGNEFDRNSTIRIDGSSASPQQEPAGPSPRSALQARARGGVSIRLRSYSHPCTKIRQPLRCRSR
jgi:hypothetical protein